MMSFAGKTVLITGAAGGIGRAVAVKMAALGASVALADLDLGAVAAVQSELGAGAEASAHRCDVANAGSCEETAREVAARHGKIDHLVHSAGIYPEKRVADMTLDEWRRVMSVNLDGTFHMCRAVIPHLSENSSIVNLA